LRNCDSTPFIHVTSDGTDDPIRQTVSVAGTADDDDDDDDPLPPEAQPVRVMTVAAQAAAIAESL
jgi:hypothetical protein